MYMRYKSNYLFPNGYPTLLRQLIFFLNLYLTNNEIPPLIQTKFHMYLILFLEFLFCSTGLSTYMTKP